MYDSWAATNCGHSPIAFTALPPDSAKYFEAALSHNIGARARGYLFERGVAPSAQTRFRLGFAPDSRNGLKEHLAQNGVSAGEMADAGLVVTGDDIAVPYDRFRNRLMFPITDFRGRIVAFGGRALSADVPAKYLNSPETELFKKRLTLYNGQAAQKAARDGRPNARADNSDALGRPMQFDHRRILATAIARLRGKMKYRPVVFELMPPAFTLLELQRTVEAISGVRLHKQNFRRLVEGQGLVEGTGRTSTPARGRPAELFRFRKDVLRERPAPGLRLGMRAR